MEEGHDFEPRKKGMRGVFPMSADLFTNIALKMGWMDLYESEGKDFDAYRTLWKAVMLCHRDRYCTECKKSFVIAELKHDSKLKDAGGNLCPKCKKSIGSRIHIPTELKDKYERYYCTNMVYDPNAEQDVQNYSKVLSLWQLAPAGRSQMSDEGGPLTIKIRGFVDSNETFIGELEHVEWNQLLNFTLAKLEPIASDVKLIIMRSLFEHQELVPSWVDQFRPPEESDWEPPQEEPQPQAQPKRGRGRPAKEKKPDEFDTGMVI